MNGSFSNVSGRCPNLTFLFSGQTVEANGGTSYRKSSCRDVTDGRSGSVKAQRVSDGTLSALRIQVNDQKKH